MKKNTFVLSKKVTKCKRCGEEIANLVGHPLETVCEECQHTLEYQKNQKTQGQL